MASGPYNQSVGGQGTMRVPDYVDPAVGYRMWNVSQLDDRWYLSSATTLGVMWPTDGPLRAQHIGDGAKWLALNIYHLAEEDPVVPVRGCACGIYAYNDPDRLKTAAEGVVFRRVFGEVALYGKVWEHETGYRAELARVRALWYVPGGIGLPAVQTLGARYGVPVVEHGR